MAKEIRVLLVEPMEQPRLVTVEHTLENLQKLVDGYIQRLLADEDGKPYDILKGTFFICGIDVEDFCSISDELAEKYMEKFRWPEMFFRTLDEHVVWVKLKPGEEPKVIV